MEEQEGRHPDPAFYERERARTFPGQGESLGEALDDAWDQIPPEEKEGRSYRVAEIIVEGTNPINWFRVILRGEG